MGRGPMSGLRPGTLRLCTPQQLSSFCSSFLGLSGSVVASNSERQHDVSTLSAVEAEGVFVFISALNFLIQKLSYK